MILLRDFVISILKLEKEVCFFKIVFSEVDEGVLIRFLENKGKRYLVIFKINCYNVFRR